MFLTHRQLASVAVVIVVVLRNCFAAGFTFAIGPWLTNEGLKNTTIEIGIMALGINLSAAVMAYYGKSLRRLSAPKYNRLAADLGDASH